MVKRIFDIIVAGICLLVLLPLFLSVAVLIKIDSEGPVVFRTRRLGRGGVPFTMYKLRTMVQGASPIFNADGSLRVLPNDTRLTKLGKRLRDYSIDELPQLWNILRGDMSIVGPRPDEVNQLTVYDDLLRMKLQVKPGLANLPAVMGRNALSWRERAAFDRYYVEHRSFPLDLKIILLTLPVVLKRDGIYSPLESLSHDANTNVER
jgi:lipopolysaccharide/colanic/teichoic acid biosynthesis glycosyltransferase